MNLERVFLRVVVLCVPLFIGISSCKKKKAFKEENGQGAEDVRSVQNQNDEVARDLNMAIMEQSLLRGGAPTPQAVKTQICGAEIDTVSVMSGIVKLHYTGNTCSGEKKTGDITATLTNYPIVKWKNQGCVLNIEFVSYKVILADGRSVQYDGTATLTNESGNTWYEMINGLSASSLIQRYSTNDLEVTYDEGNTAVFNADRRLTYDYSGKIISGRVEGLGSSNGFSNLDNWGQDRNGSNFTTQISSTLIWKSTCGVNALTDGEEILRVDGKDFEMKCDFAVDESGKSISDDSTCPYGWKMSWSYKRKTSTKVVAY